MISLRDKGVKIMKKIICCLATAAVAFGMLSAVTFVKANAVTAPSFTTAKVSLNENIVLKFGIENYTQDYTLTFGYKGEAYEGKVENGEAAFSLVTPQYLDEVVTATLTKGEETITKTYSVKEYLYSLVHAKNTDEAFKNYSCEKFVKMKTLAVDMLEYGAEAQKKYLSVTDNLVTKDLTNAEKAYATTFAPPDENAQATLSGEKAGYEWVSAGIRFDYNVSLYFVVKPLTENAVLKLKINDNEVIDRYIVDKDGNYKFRYENVNVVDFANKYTVKVLDEAGNAIGQTLSYSVNTYVLNKHADESMGAITRAVYNYGVSAKAFETAGNGHAYDHVELLKADGSKAEVIAKPDFERKDVVGDGTTKDTLDYSLNYSKARFVCACGETHEDNEVEATLVDKTRTYKKDDDSTEVIVNGKTYVADIQVLYARCITTTIEEVDGKVYFVNTFDVKGYTTDEFTLFDSDNGDKSLADIIDDSIAGKITFKADITSYEAKYSEKNGIKTADGNPYGLGVKIRGEKVNVASQNQNGDVYYAAIEDKTIITDNGHIYRTGKFWGKSAVMISNFAVKSTAMEISGDDILLTIDFIDCVSNNNRYRLFTEGSEVQELDIVGSPNVDKANYTVKLTVKLDSEKIATLPAYIHLTLNGEDRNPYSNAYPVSNYVATSVVKDSYCYSAESNYYGLRIIREAGSAIVPLTEDNVGDIFRYNAAHDALEANRIMVTNGEITEKIDYLANGFVNYILFDLYKKDDESKTSRGSFKMIKNVLYAGDKSFGLIGWTENDGYTNLYIMMRSFDEQNLKNFNDLLKAALGGNSEAGDYVLSAQIIMKSGSGFVDSEKVFLPTDYAHTFTVS